MRSTVNLLELLNDAASDTVAGIAGWVRYIIIRFRVDDERCAVSFDERIRLARLKGDNGRGDVDDDFAIRADLDVGQVAFVKSLGVVEPMLLLLRIKVGAGRLEVRGLAFAELVDMDGVRTWRQLLRLQVNDNLVAFLRQSSLSNGLAFGVYHRDRFACQSAALFGSCGIMSRGM